jgi:yeast amino acid transporter
VISGPGGTLLAVAIVGIIAIAVMEGVSELVQCFPVPNAIVEYVKTFVDEDLGWVVGIAYWLVFLPFYI